MTSGVHDQTLLAGGDVAGLNISGETIIYHGGFERVVGLAIESGKFGCKYYQSFSP